MKFDENAVYTFWLKNEKCKSMDEIIKISYNAIITRRAHYMEDVKAKGCPDPPTLEECLDELEKLAIKMMNGE